MIRFKTMGAVALVAALAGGAALAQAPRGGRGGRGGGPDGPLGGIPVEALNLSQAQQDQIRDIPERNRQAMQALQERMRSDVIAALTAEQQAKLKQLQAERPSRREGGRNQQQP